MFSYRHAFHAGNHADVLKHAVFVAMLQHLARKDKAFWVFDTHAGAGSYRLDGAQARKNAEHQGGVASLWQAARLPGLLAAYRTEIARFDQAQRQARMASEVMPVRADAAAGAAATASVGTDSPATGSPAAADDSRAICTGGDAAGLPRWGRGQSPRMPRAYPGSPALALQMMRPQDRLRCFEAHPTEIRVLQRNLSWAGRRVQIFGEDGFEGLKALLPPVSRRGVILIDPSYEDKRDYARVRRTLLEAIERFATGMMLVWYPLVRRREAVLLMEQLPRLPVQDWLDVRLQVCQPPEDGHGLYGSGLFVINPPFTLAPALAEALPVLQQLLGQDGSAGWSLQTSADAPAPARVAAESSVGRRVERSPLARAQPQPGARRRQRVAAQSFSPAAAEEREGRRRPAAVPAAAAAPAGSVRHRGRSAAGKQGSGRQK